MERTESTIVQVNPNYENQKVQEMQIFGWNLQGRQEVVGHLKAEDESDSLKGILKSSLRSGDLPGGSAINMVMGDGALAQTVTYDHYVKLHFVRPLSLPGIKELREYEAAYRALSVPAKPRILPGGWLIIFWYFAWPIYFFVSYKPKKEAWDKAVQNVQNEAGRLLGEAHKLTVVA